MLCVSNLQHAYSVILECHVVTYHWNIICHLFECIITKTTRYELCTLLAKVARECSTFLSSSVLASILFLTCQNGSIVVLLVILAILATWRCLHSLCFWQHCTWWPWCPLAWAAYTDHTGNWNWFRPGGAMQGSDLLCTILRSSNNYNCGHFWDLLWPWLGGHWLQIPVILFCIDYCDLDMTSLPFLLGKTLTTLYLTWYRPHRVLRVKNPLRFLV